MWEVPLVVCSGLWFRRRSVGRSGGCGGGGGGSAEGETKGEHGGDWDERLDRADWLSD